MTEPTAPTELLATKLIGGGRALGHADGLTWMIRGGLPGERLRVQPNRRRARIIEAEVIEVLADPHPARLDESCPHADLCGGCDWPQVDPLLGADLKVLVAAEAAARFPEIADRIRHADITRSAPAYRLRSRLHWDPATGALGFYGPRTWTVSPITHCRIIAPSLTRRLPRLTEAMTEHCPAPVDVEIIEGGGSAVAALRPARGGPRSISARWVPPGDADLNLGGFHRLTKSSQILSGWGAQEVRIDLPLPLGVPIGSFFQGNRHLVPWLFQRVADLIGPGDEPVIDLHGGVGFLAAAARWIGRSDLTLVEIHQPSAAAARHNLPGARIVASSAEDFLQEHNELPPRAVAVTDPPRSGMTKELRRRLLRWRPRKVVMLGCDPATWSRDTAEFMEHGYNLIHLELADLFPFTHHVEVLAVLETD